MAYPKLFLPREQGDGNITGRTKLAPKPRYANVDMVSHLKNMIGSMQLRRVAVKYVVLINQTLRGHLLSIITTLRVTFVVCCVVIAIVVSDFYKTVLSFV